MSVQDYRISEVIIRLHEIANYIELEVGKGTISQAVRDAADDLNTLFKRELNREPAN